MNDILENAIKKNQIGGAYLIEGSVGAAGREVDEFLLKIFCEEKTGCGQCPGCKKVLAKTHADIIEVAHSTNNIKVSDIEQIPAKAFEKSFEGGYKAIVIRQAGDMVEAAQNKLLKIIEEPPKNTVFIFTVNNIKNVLPTIFSRCIHIKADVCEEEDAQEIIKDKTGVSTMTAMILAKTCGGDVYLAQNLVKNDYIAKRDDIVKLCVRLFGARNMATSIMTDLIMKYEDDLKTVFFALDTFLNDILIYKYTKDNQRLKNIDKIGEIKHCSELCSDRGLLFAIGQESEANRKMQVCQGINKKLMVEDMLFKILEVVL